MMLKTKFWRVCLWTLFIVVVASFAYLRKGKDFASEIRAGKLGYTNRLGWVNWGHSRPERVQEFLQELHSRWKASGGKPFLIDYKQQMTANWKIIGLESILSRTYRVDECRDESEFERVALGIFREVSEAFEKMQGSFPNAIDARSQDSSFRAGDLHGNIIAFYRSLRGYSDQQVRDWVQPASIEDSLRKLNEGGFRPEYVWQVPAALTGGPLDELSHDPTWFMKRASLIHEHQTWFRFFIP